MSNEPIHILLVTPEEEKWVSLYKYLARNNFVVEGKVAGMIAALALLREGYPDLIIVDARLLGNRGLTCCQEMQAVHPPVKIVLVTGDDDSLQPAALHAGIAGCIHDDLPLAEWPSLLAYINGGGAIFSRAVIERLLAREASPEIRVARVIVGPLIVDLPCRRVTLNGEGISLTPREFALLACLARHAGQVVTFDRLLTEAWGYGLEAGTPAQVRLYIARLRRKLKDDSRIPDFVVTERGVGYRLRSPTQWRRVCRPGYQAQPPELFEASYAGALATGL